MKGHVSRDAAACTASTRGVREAQRRLGAILRAARKLSVTSDDLARLPATKRLADAAAGHSAPATSHHQGEDQQHQRGGGGGRHVLMLPLAASGVALLAALLLFLCAGDGPPLARLRNASDPVPSTAAGLAKQRVLRAAAAAAAAAAEAAATSGPPRIYDRRDYGGASYRSSAYSSKTYTSNERSSGGAGSGGSNGRITTARSGGAMAEREGNNAEEDESADSLFDAPIRLMRR